MCRECGTKQRVLSMCLVVVEEGEEGARVCEPEGDGCPLPEPQASGPTDR